MNKTDKFLRLPVLVIAYFVVCKTTSGRKYNNFRYFGKYNEKMSTEQSQRVRGVGGEAILDWVFRKGLSQEVAFKLSLTRRHQPGQAPREKQSKDKALRQERIKSLWITISKQTKVERKDNDVSHQT